MKNNKCLIFETVKSCSNMKIVESDDNLIHLSGTFAVCGIKNNNHRVYEQSNYASIIEQLNKQISEGGLMGELEHPASLNINLENVSHKIDSISIDENGVVTGTITLLNTPKGNIARGIVEGGLPIYISSRGVGKIDENGNVTLSSIKTYDLVGTPGFSQAQLNLAEGFNTIECLSPEQLDESEVYSYMMYEAEEEEKPDEEKPEEEKNKEQVQISLEKVEKALECIADKVKEIQEKEVKPEEENKNESLENSIAHIDEMIAKVNALLND